MSLATSFTPVAAITIAVLLVGEDLGDGIGLGSSVIIGGILLALYGRLIHSPPPRIHSSQKS